MSLLRPGRVAVIGASDRPDSVGARFVIPLLDQRFGGEIVPVHPTASSVLGVPAVASLHDVEPVDVAIVAVATHRVLEVASNAAAACARYIHVFTGGFAETGTQAGRKLQDELRRAVVDAEARLIGPNCMGIHRPSYGWTFRHDVPMTSGTVGLVSQSGGVAIAGIRLAAKRGLSAALSLGNCADLEIADGVALLAADDETEEIAVYVESAGSGRLMDAVREAARRKPVRVWAVGTTPRANAAATYHTGAPGGPLADDLQAAGADVVGSLEELINGTTARCAGVPAPPRVSRSVVTVSISGGVSVILSEALERAAFTLPTLPEATQARLAKIGEPLAANVANPIDLGGSYLSRGRIRAAMDLLAAEPGIDHLVVHLALDYLEEVEARHEGFVPGWLSTVLEGLGARRGPTTAFLWPRAVSDWDTVARKRCAAAGIEVVDDLGDLVRTIAR